MHIMIFFKIVINANMIALYIISARCNNIHIYKKWLNYLNWPKEIFKLKNLN